MFRHYLYIVCFIVVSFISNNLQAETLSVITNIQKSPNDQREYLALNLPNQLQVMLVSDPTTDKASAAMDVYVGSADDPSDFLGLAHFLEHMLFLGTKKYPTPDEYQKFISEHGGAHNAMTSLEHTNYFFDIQAGFLEEALDRFAQQFTAPLFNAEYVEREVNAVHSEYTSKIKDDGRRFFETLKLALATDHPYSKFSVGNLDTLKDTPSKSLRDALLAFYEAHYSANNMRLVVLGKEPLPVLKDWVVEKFSNIPDRNITRREVSQPFFNENALPKQVNIQSVMDKRSLTLAFPIPSDRKHLDAKPVDYIANLIGHEGKGSLLSKLKELELVDSLSAGKQFDTNHNALFMINMSLTQKGLAEYDSIIDIVFDYIAMLKQQGIKKHYFDEQVTLLDIAFTYQEKTEPLHFTSSLAMALQDSQPEKVLSEYYTLKDYAPELYQRYLSALSPLNMLIVLNAKELPVNQKSPWYDVPYQISPVDAERLARFNIVNTYLDLFPPAANEFIPENTRLLATRTSKQPELLRQSEGYDVWYAADTSFGTPKANLFLTLRSAAANSSADHYNKTDIMIALVNDMLSEFTYPAYLAGLQFELYQHMRGLTIKISGYDDKQSILLQKILSTLKTGTFREDRFNIIKERLTRELENAKDKKPFEQAFSLAQNLLISPSWDEQERLASLATLTFNEMTKFREVFLDTLQTVLLANGNLTRASTLNIASLIEASLLKDATMSQIDRAKIIRLEGQNSWINYRLIDHPDTGYLFYLQGKDKTFREQAKFLLLNQAIATDYYADIRTDKQLGYIVFATGFSLLDVPAIAFVVQSPSSSAETLHKETMRFLNATQQTVSKMPEQSLERFKQAVISKLLKQNNTLYSVSNKYWQDIDRENYSFNTNEALANAVQQLNVQDLQQLIEELLSNKGRHLLLYTAKELGLSEDNLPAVKLSKDRIKTLQLF